MGIDKDTPIFDSTSFSDIARDIYNKKKEKDNQITLLIQELQPFVKNIGDAAVLVPLIKEYMEIAVKNDEVLVKLAGIIQKLIIADSADTKTDSEYGLTADEKKQLLVEANALIRETTLPISRS